MPRFDTLLARLARLERLDPPGYLASRLLLEESVGWLESGAHETFTANPTVATLARTIAGDIAQDGPGECSGRHCHGYGTDACGECAYNPRRMRDARFAEACREAVRRYRDRQAQSVPV